MSAIVRFGAILGAGILLLSAPTSGFFLTKIFLEASASSRWPHVEGILEKSEVKDISLGPRRRYEADVLYSYHVAGVAYQGNRVRMSDGEVDQREAIEDLLKDLVVGNRVAVYYDPKRKSQSVLRPGAGFQEWFLLLVPVGIFVWGVITMRRALAIKTCNTNTK
jgi:hypothetical protein